MTDKSNNLPLIDNITNESIETLIKVEIDEINNDVFESFIEVEANQIYPQIYQNGDHDSESIQTNDCQTIWNKNVLKSNFDTHVENFHPKLCSNSVFPSLQNIKNKEAELHQLNDHASQSNRKIDSSQINFQMTPNKQQKVTIKTYDCQICSNKYVLKSNLDAHVHQFHSEKRINDVLPSNTKTINYIKDYKCNVCPKSYTSKQGISKHIREYHPELCINSNVPLDLIRSQNELNRQEQSRDNGKMFKCFKCPKTYPLKSSLNRHVREYHSEIFIEDVFSTQQNVKNNEANIHIAKKKIIESIENDKSEKSGELNKCEICSLVYARKITFDSQEELEEHIMLQHDKNNKQTLKVVHKCNVCLKIFLTYSDLKLHSQSHFVEKPYECNICSKRFSFNLDLVKHKKSHAEVILKKCDICDVEYLCEEDMKNHQKLHSSEKPYKCDICQKRFFFNLDLIKHKKKCIHKIIVI
ncbi:zinc finger protein 665-like [Daktulosphaira vitifoliae]|uniref:zinc finger protein 665-like n=1 Tax=Daktulosphaira vitifoliae TaxID=58002 RepID=UPI0021AA8974|nr:zinc finger protein 665-like [Daktulosphaira vitifoliae]XP_050522102.1 zinc finger protein 665-like [Daktulosphaira vitifoliae]